MIEINILDTVYKIELDRSNSTCLIDGRHIAYELLLETESTIALKTGSTINSLHLTKIPSGILVTNGDLEIEAQVTSKLDSALKLLGLESEANDEIKEIKAPMPGSILSISIEEGKNVSKGDPLLILEAMKMENVIKSPIDGCIDKIHVAVGENVAKNSNLISFI